MYVCGITVYDYCHVGHARMMMAFDVVRRWLRASGYAVTYVRNITDIDDKIIRRAGENGESIARVDRALHRRDERGRRRARHRAARPRAARDRARARDARHDRPARERRSSRTRRATATSTSRCAASPATASCRASRHRRPARRRTRRCVDAGKVDPLDFVLWKKAKPDEPADAQVGVAVGRRPTRDGRSSARR